MTVITEQEEDLESTLATGGPAPLVRRTQQVTPPRILLVDDNPLFQKIAARQLNNLGYTTDIVHNGQEALDALDKAPYDLILMDCVMPVMDGYEATQHIRQLPGVVAKTPIIAMTGKTHKDDRKRCFDVGMNDYIAKPIYVEKLAVLLNMWCPLAAG